MPWLDYVAGCRFTAVLGLDFRLSWFHTLMAGNNAKKPVSVSLFGNEADLV
jgi:hypothetical protein